MKIVWITDPHLTDPGSEWPAGVDPWPRLRACLNEIGDRHGDADRIVVSGDLIQRGNTRAYGPLAVELAATGIPVRVLPGNHDDRAALRAAFPEAEHADGFIQGWEGVAGTHLLYLDTVAAAGGHHGELCAARLGWLVDRIAAAAEGPLLVFLHHPPAGIGVPALDDLNLRDAVQLAAILGARPGPTHLFSGHVHRNAAGVWSGNPFATLKSTHVQFDLDMGGSKLARSVEAPGYGVILVDGHDIVVNYRDVTIPL